MIIENINNQDNTLETCVIQIVIVKNKTKETIFQQAETIILKKRLNSWKLFLVGSKFMQL